MWGAVWYGAADAFLGEYHDAVRIRIPDLILDGAIGSRLIRHVLWLAGVHHAGGPCGMQLEHGRLLPSCPMQ